MRADGIRLAVISNWVWGAPELMHDLELARHFEATIISSRIGYQKPHRAIFDHALALMKVEAAQAVHVGDSYKADVIGARAAGITPVLIDRHLDDPARLPGDDLPDDPVAVIGDIFGLLDLIGLTRPPARLAS